MPVWALDGNPCEVGGLAGTAHLLFAMTRRDTVTTIQAFAADGLTVVGHLAWASRTPDGEGGQVGVVRDAHVRRSERGIGLGLLQAAQELAGVRAWSGVAVPDSGDDHNWLGSASATAGQQGTIPLIDLSTGFLADHPPANSAVHLAFYRAGRATIAAFAADSLDWVGQLVWTISRPGGRSGGEQAGHAVGEVQRVDTRDGYGRRGIATRMYFAALQVALAQGWPAEIDHSPNRTYRGDAWAAKVGGWRPPLTKGRHKPEPEDLQRLLEERWGGQE
jgi:hypothetical protein